MDSLDGRVWILVNPSGLLRKYQIYYGQAGSVSSLLTRYNRDSTSTVENPLTPHHLGSLSTALALLISCSLDSP